MVPGHVSDAELDEAMHPGAEDHPVVVGLVGRGHDVDELGGGAGEHGVVDRVLRLEVGVDGRGADARPLGEIADREPGESFISHEPPRRIDDRLLAARRLAVFHPTVGPLFDIVLDTYTLCKFCQRTFRSVGGSAQEVPRLADVDGHRVALGDLALEQGHGQAVADLALDEPLERPGPEGRVEALAGQRVLGRRR